MILLDTHIWVWWVTQHPQLTPRQLELIQSEQVNGLGISIMSCWEIAKLVEVGKLQLTLSVNEWLDRGLSYPGIRLLDLTLPIILDSTQLPGQFHRDPADQLLVATARVHNLRLLTSDHKILAYPFVPLALP